MVCRAWAAREAATEAASVVGAVVAGRVASEAEVEGAQARVEDGKEEEWWGGVGAEAVERVTAAVGATVLLVVMALVEEPVTGGAAGLAGGQAVATEAKGHCTYTHTRRLLGGTKYYTRHRKSPRTRRMCGARYLPQ